MTEKTRNVFEAYRIKNAPDFSRPITEEQWGDIVVTIDKTTPLAVLFSHKAQVEDISADLYFRWDMNNLYVGMVTADSDIQGSPNLACGDGIQIRVSAGEEMGVFVDLYVNVAPDGVSPNPGWNQGQEVPFYENNLLISDGKIHVMLAIPLELLGLDAESGDICDGVALSVNLLRVSATVHHEYAGWLSFGNFFGNGSEFHPEIKENNVLILRDPDEVKDGRQKIEKDRIYPLDIAFSAKKNVAKRGLYAGRKIASMGGNVYALYSTKWPCVEMTLVDGDMINDFSLQKIGSKCSREVGFGYILTGGCDIVSAGDAVFAVGGSSSWEFEKCSVVYEKDTFAELAVLNVYEYTEESGVLDGYTEQIPFSRRASDCHSYITATVDNDGSKIYALYYAECQEGDSCIEVFSFDIKAKEWCSDIEVIPVSARPASPYAFVCGGVNVVYSVGENICISCVSGEKILAEGKLKDAYCAEDGTLNIIYGRDGDVVQLQRRIGSSLGGDCEKLLLIPVEAYVKMFESDGSLYCIVTRDDTLTRVRVCASDKDGFISEVKHSLKSNKRIHIIDDIMIARRDNGSQIKDHVDLLVAGTRGTVSKWYYLSVPLSFENLS